MAVHHVEAMDRYLSGVARAAPGALVTAKASQQRCLLSLLAKTQVSVEDAGTCLELLSQQSYWSVEEQEAFARAVTVATEAALDGGCQATKRGQQDYQHIMNYMPEDVWQKLCATEMAESEKVACVGQLMVSLGFLNPLHEKTAQKVAGLLSFMPGAQPSATLQHLFDRYKVVRQGLSAACAAAPSELQSWPVVAQLPEDPQHLEECWRKHGLGDRRPVFPASLNKVALGHLTAQIPMRDTPRLVCKTAFLLCKGNPWRRSGSKRPAWQQALQTQMALMQGTHALPAQAGAQLQLVCSAPAACATTAVAEPRAQLQPVSAPAAVSPQAPLLALQAPTGSLPQTPAVDASEKPVPQPVAFTLKEAAQQPSALAAAKALAEDLLEKPGQKPRPLKLRLRGKQSAQVPAAAKKAPKSQVKKAAGKAQSAGQRAASSAAPNSKEEIEFRVSKGLPLALLKAHAKGCGKCRHRAGCTNSCWKKRGFLLDL